MDASAIAGLAAPSVAPVSNAAMGSSKLGKDEFLKLLMAQLAHQDPTSPVDSQAFVAQLAQFANVEQLSSVNSQLESLLVAQSSSNNTGMAALVGKTIAFKSDAVSLELGKPAALLGNLTAAATEVTAVITDSNGKTVRTLQLGAKPSGLMQAEWDGRDDAGTLLAPGTYKVKLTANDAAGKSIAVDARASALVSGVSFANGYPELIVNSARVKLTDVVEINQTPNTGTLP
jgi:flagellar basal-body rod modification protein FlgD